MHHGALTTSGNSHQEEGYPPCTLGRAWLPRGWWGLGLAGGVGGVACSRRALCGGGLWLTQPAAVLTTLSLLGKQLSLRPELSPVDVSDTGACVLTQFSLVFVKP